MKCWASDHHDASIVNEQGIKVKKLKINDDLDEYRASLRREICAGRKRL